MGDHPEESTADRSHSPPPNESSTEPQSTDPASTETSAADRRPDSDDVGDAPADASARHDAAAEDPPAADAANAEDDPDAAFESRGSGMRGRDVAVPMRVYKTVTVFSTLIAVVCVVGGFVVLDSATDRAQLPLSEVDPVLAIAGIATILFGAAVYAFGTRFRAAGMGRSKNDDDESADNG